MKRVLLFAVILTSVSLAAIGVEAKTAGTSNAVSTGSAYAAGQVFNRHGFLRHIVHPKHKHRKNNSNVSYETRLVYKGNKEYRDTYRITWKNGQEHEKRVDRVRIR